MVDSSYFSLLSSYLYELLLEAPLQFGNPFAYLFGLTLKEIFTVFGIAETVATGNVGRIVLHVGGKIQVVVQQQLLLFQFLYYFFRSHEGDCLRIEI